MKQLRNYLALVLISIFLVPLISVGNAADNKLVIYTGSGPEITDPLFAKFKEEYPGIDIELVKAGSGELLSRIRAEKGNPGGDVLFGGEPLLFEVNKELFEPYACREDSNMVRQDKNNLWHIYSFMPQAILVNTRILKSERDWPKTLKELADPKWRQKGKIALADPNKSGTGATIFCGMASLYGWPYVENVLKNAEVLPGSDAMFDAVKDGSNPLGFINEDLGLKWEKMNLPVKMIFPQDGITNTFDASAIIAGAKNRTNAQRFIDFMASKDAHLILKNPILRRSTRKDVTPAAGMIDLRKFKLIANKPLSRDEISKNFNELLEKVRAGK